MSYHLEKSTESKQRVSGLENELEEIRGSYEEHMKVYNDLCVAYETLAEENKELSDALKSL